MKLNYTFPFDIKYLPPRCKKFRHKEGNGSVEIEIKELTNRTAPVAMVINQNDGLKTEIRAYKGKLFKRVIDELEYKYPTGYRTKYEDRYVHCHIGHNYWNYSEEQAIKDIKSKSKELILVDNELYELTEKPFYIVHMNNMSESCSLSVETNSDYREVGISYEVNELDKAKEKLHELALVANRKFENILNWVDILLPKFID